MNDLLTIIFSYILIAAFSITSVRGSASFRQAEKKILDKIIGKGVYDPRIRPSGANATFDGDEPCIVKVNIFIRSISRIDDVTMEYATQITFREEWRDSRLVFDDMGGRIRFLVLTDPEKLWKPDLFFSNEKYGHFHDIIMPNVLLRIFPNGDILYSIRISLNLFCPMDLKYFPLDIQNCSIRMASYGYTTEDLVFLWRAGDPVQITKSLHLPRFTLMKYLTSYCTSKTNTGEYSCLKVELVFKREFSYYLFLIYVPCCMLVIVSWVSFWIDPNSAAARVLLGVTSLLTMSRQISGINASLPPVSYTKAVDVWTGCCLIFVFGALIEFAIVNYVSRTDAVKAGKQRLRRNQGIVGARKKFDTAKDSGIESSDVEDGPIGYAKALGSTKLPRKRPPKGNFFSSWLSRFTTRSKKIDVTSRIVFPFLFAIFNAFYWTKYLLRDELMGL
ncbi:glutamate-gated chloride channel-like [Panonychus citri]|uniref:glutamate-gated chloride channel-like n=1 Tax=Panonychus citri TaxID=50023 RepID=UPI00230834AE|nr:glutamate-gated chloride channel-like [Panonychus citri]